MSLSSKYHQSSAWFASEIIMVLNWDFFDLASNITCPFLKIHNAHINKNKAVSMFCILCAYSEFMAQGFPLVT